MVGQGPRQLVLQILAYAPTEFFHCQHCEVVWKQIGIGDRFRAEQRDSGLLPTELAAEYSAIANWVAEAIDRYGERLSISLVDAVSIEGVWKRLRFRARRFPAFIFADGERIEGFDEGRLNAALETRLGPEQSVSSPESARR